MALKVGELFASFNLDTSGISSAVIGAEKKLSELGKGLAIGGAALTTAVTAPLTKAAKTIYNAGSGFDAQMSKVFAIIGEEATGSVENMEALRKEALEMGSTTSFTASEAGEAMQYMAMAGWKVDDMLSGLAPIMDLAAASGESLGTVSDIVTDALTAFGMTAEETAHFTDVLAAASSNSNTNVAIMGESFKYVAPLAGSLGYSVDDVAVALGLMANAGIKGSMAGTSLRQVLSNLISPTDAQAEAMKALGVSLFDSNGKVEGFAELMGDLHKAASESGFDMQELNRQVADLDQQLSNGSITQDQYDARIQEMTAGNNEFLKAISDLAGARGLSGLLAIMNATEEDFKKLTKAVEGSSGAAKTMAKTMLDNAQGDITLFNSALEGLEITLWGLAEGGFRKAVQSATALVESFRNADQETLEGTLRMAGLAAAVGPVMVALGGIITALPKVAGTFKVLAGPGALLTVGLIALGAAAMDSGNSMGKTFVKGAAKAGKKVRQFGRDVKKQIPQLTENMNEFLGSLSEGIQEGVPALLDGLGDILTTGISALAGSMGKISNVSRTLIRTLAGGITNNMPEIASAAIDLMTEMAAALIGNIPVVLEGMSTVITSLVKEVNTADWSSIGGRLGESIQTSLNDTGVWFKKLAMGDQFTEEATWEDVGVTLATNVLNGIKLAFGNTKDFVGSLLLGEQYNPDDEWGVFGEKIIDKIFESADKSIDSATSFVGGILTGISDLFTDDAMDKAAGTLSTIAGRIIDSIFAEIPKLADRAGTLLEKLGALILGDESSAGLATNVIAGATSLADAIFTALETGFSGSDGTSAIQKLLDVLGKAFSQENLSRITTNLEGFIGAIFTGMTNVLPNLADKAVEVVKGMIDLMFKTNESGTSLFGSALTSVQTLVTTLVQEIVNFIPQAASTVTNLLSTLLDTLFAPQGENGEERSLVQGALDSISKVVHSVLTSVPGMIRTMSSEAVSIITALGAELTRKDPNTDKYIASGLVDSLSDLITQAINDVVALIPSLGEAITGIIGAIGDVLLKKDENGDYLITSLADSLISLVKDAVGLAVNAVPALADTIKGIISTIAGVLTEKDESGKYKATGIIDSLTQMISDAVSDVIAFIPSLGDTICGIIGAIGDVLLDTDDEGHYLITSLADSLITLVENAVTLAVESIPGIADLVKGIIREIAGILTEKDEKGKYKATGIIDSLTEMISDAINEVVAFIPSIGDTIGGIIGAIGDVLLDKDDEGNYLITNLSDSLINLVKNAVTLAANSIPDLADTITGIIGKIAGILSEKDTTTGQYKATGIVDSLTTMVTDAIADVIEIIPTLGSSAADIITAIGEAMFGSDENDEGAVAAGVTALTDIVQTVFDTINNDVIPTMGASIGGILSTIAGFFTPEKLGALGSGLGDLAGSVLTGIVDTLVSVIDTVLAITDNTDTDEIFSGILTGIESFAGKVVEALANAIPKLENAGSKILGKISEIFTGEGFSATFTAGAEIAGSIIGAVVDALPGVANAAVSILGGIASLFTSEGFTATFSAGANIAGAIITAITEAIPNAIDAAGNIMNAGLTLAEGILDSLTTGLSEASLNLNFGAIVQKLITGITTVIPKMLEVGGKAVSAGAVLAGELVVSLAKGFTDESLNVNFGGIMQSIVTGLTNAARDLPTLLENTLSAGAQIANAIMGSISSALSDLDASGVANDLSQAAIALLHGLLTTITDFGTNPDVQSFIQNLGNGFRSAMSMLGDVLGDIVRYIFSEEGLRTIWNAGVALAQVLLQAFEGALTGIGEFMLHFFVDEESLEEAQNTLYSDIVQLLRGGLGESVEGYEFTAIGQEAATHVIEAFKESVSGENLSQYNASGLSGFLKSYFGRAVNNAIDAQVLSGTDAIIWAKRAEQLSDDFWNTLAQAILDNKGSLGDVDLLDLLFYKTKQEKATNATNEIQRTLEEYGFVLGETAQEAVNTGVGAAMDNQTNGLAADGFARAVTSGKGDAEKAVMALGNDVVEQFMLTMSAENGQEIGNQFVGGIITAVGNNSTTLSSNATQIATLVYTTLSGILKYSSGFSIGQNFGLGLANGIANMTSIVSSAAWNLGITAANALSSALDEHSPSKVTGKSGRNFGLGFIGGIEDEMSMAQRVAESMGMSAAYSLRDSIAEMRGESVRQLSVPVQNRSTQVEQYTAENERIAQQYVEAIARALNGAKVVMQDEEVGMLVMPTVSKEIAYATSKRREATL